MDGKILAKARKILDLSQEQMAKKLSISFQTYNGYENGKTIPKTKHSKINEVLFEAKEKKENADNIIDIDSTDLLNDLIKEIRGFRRENKEIKKLLEDILSEKNDSAKLEDLSSGQMDILKELIGNIAKSVEELKKADKKSASKLSNGK